VKFCIKKAKSPKYDVSGTPEAKSDVKIVISDLKNPQVPNFSPSGRKVKNLTFFDLGDREVMSQIRDISTPVRRGLNLTSN